MAQGTTFRGDHQTQEQLTLVHHAVVEFFLGRGLNRIHAFGRRREILGHALDHVARELKVSIAIGMLARQIAHAGQGAHIGHGAGKGNRLFHQGLGRGRELVEQLLARQHRQHFALDGLAADNHVQGRLDADHARQALCAACARNEANLDFGQRHAAARCDHAVVATQRQFQAAAHGHGVNCRHRRLGAVFKCEDQAQEVGVLDGLGRAEFLDVGAARECLASTGDHDGLDGVVGNGFLQPSHDAQARGKTQTIHGRVVEGDHGDVALNGVVSTHENSLKKEWQTTKKNGRSIFILER